MNPPIPKNLGVKFARIELYVTVVDGKQIITFEPARFMKDGPAIMDFMQRCTGAMESALNLRTEDERIPLRGELDKFIKEQPDAPTP